MRLGIISDVHGNLIALRRVLAHLGTQSVDRVVNLGDCVSAPLWPRETFELLEELGATTVRGNHDRWLADDHRCATQPTVAFTRAQLDDGAVATLTALPATLEIAPGVLAVHGTPTSDTDYLLEEAIDERLCFVTTETLDRRLEHVTAEVILCGHSHQQHVAAAGDGRLVINPGAVGAPRYAGNASPRANEAGSPHARYAIATRSNGRWSVDLFALDYDWDSVAHRAQSVGRTDWAAAFMKGESLRRTPRTSAGPMAPPFP